MDFILVARPPSEDEDKFGFAGSALPALHVVPRKGFLSWFNFWVSAERFSRCLSPASSLLATTVHYTAPKSCETWVAINEWMCWCTLLILPVSERQFLLSLRSIFNKKSHPSTHTQTLPIFGVNCQAKTAQGKTWAASVEQKPWDREEGGDAELLKLSVYGTSAHKMSRGSLPGRWGFPQGMLDLLSNWELWE